MTVEFWRNNSQDITGDGDAIKVFSTVLDAIEQFIKRENPIHISFVADNDEEEDEEYQRDTRINLYKKLIQRYAHSWGYSLKNLLNVRRAVIFDLVKIKQDVA